MARLVHERALPRTVTNIESDTDGVVTTGAPASPPATRLRLSAPGLGALRAAIDRVDRASADLLVRRARMARRVALLKVLTGMPGRDPQREHQVRDHYASILRKAGWSERSLDSWLETMLSASRDLQAHLTIAVQGSPGSWSDISLRSNLASTRIVYCDTVDDAWTAARKGEADAVWLAARNSTIGDVEATRSIRREAECWADYEQRVTHALLAPPGTDLDAVRHVEAHPLAFAQCRANLDRLLPDAQRVPAIDGAKVTASLRGRPGTATLADARLAATQGLTVLRDAMNDEPDNRTTFQLLLPKEIF